MVAVLVGHQHGGQPLGLDSRSFRAVVIRRAEMPASMRMWVVPSLTTRLFPGGTAGQSGDV